MGKHDLESFLVPGSLGSVAGTNSLTLSDDKVMSFDCPIEHAIALHGVTVVAQLMSSLSRCVLAMLTHCVGPIAGTHNTVSQPMVVSYEKGPLVVAGSGPLERVSSGANINANALYDNVHRVAKVSTNEQSTASQCLPFWIGRKFCQSASQDCPCER